MGAIADLRDHFYRYRVALLRRGGMPETSHQDHAAMIAAMKQGNADLTEQLVRTHILKGRDVVLREVREGLIEA